MRTDLVSDALTMACSTRRPANALFHSDRGCQYTSHEYRKLAKDHGILLSLGRKGECWDKALVSYCTPLRWWGGMSIFEADPLAFDVTGIAGGWRVEQPDVLVVGLMGWDQAGSVPGLDGGGVHSELFGELADGEQSSSAEPLEMAGQAVRPAQVQHDAGGEGFSGPGAVTGGVESFGGLSVGVGVE
jgi:hypothetical protein